MQLWASCYQHRSLCSANVARIIVKEMFGRVTGQSIRQGCNTLKSYLCHGYGQVKRMTHNIDYGIDLLARTYKAIQPALRDAAPDVEKRVTAGASALKGDYNQLRARVQDVDDRATSVVHTLKKKVPELNL